MQTHEAHQMEVKPYIAVCVCTLRVELDCPALLAEWAEGAAAREGPVSARQDCGGAAAARRLPDAEAPWPGTCARQYRCTEGQTSSI